MLTKALLPEPGSSDASVNLLHLRLFHHFQNSTLQTLLCGREAWEHALQLSFQFEFLMNAILCVSARHLAVLSSEDATYQTVATSHLCHASSGLRQELSKGGSSVNFDAFLATSILLYYDTWTSVDYFSPQSPGDIMSDAWTDRVFGFSFSLKKTLLTGFQHSCEEPSRFRKQLLYTPSEVLAQATKISDDRLAEYKEFFSYHRPLRLEMLNTPLPSTLGIDESNSDRPINGILGTGAAFDAPDNAYAQVVSRLCLILPFLSQAESLSSGSSNESHLLPVLAKYILSFPLLGYSPFPTMIERGDEHALLLLYHFYRAVRILLSPADWWWAHKRAVVAEAVLRDRLISAIAKQSNVPYLH
ncbi:hypothetical protein F5Y19DRAFT_429816 [Xylariaceae sp. FL1651]|nr:hypothetical protein F5Y19DRAFT_429816 [Xylariaceae sp. FL1651]